MSATKQDIKHWIEKGKKMGATHLIVACDTFDYENYPVFVLPEEDANEKYEAKMGINMQTVDEVYDLQKDVDAQLSEHRAFHLPPKLVE